jgi:hypothetical protein
MASRDLSSQAQAGKGAPAQLKFYSPYPFAGINQSASRISMADSEFFWIENFIKVGDAYYRTLYDAGAPFFRAPSPLSIVYFFWFTIGTSPFVVVFLSDGSAVQLAWPGGEQTQLAGAGTFYQSATGFLPACSQYGTLYLLISNRNTSNDYWAWDGSLLYTAGTAAPRGVTLTGTGNNYTSLPTVTAFGGLGSGLTVTPVINAGQVVNVNITNPGSGYGVGDIVQLQFSGGGSDTGAILKADLNIGGVAAANISSEGSGYSTATIAFSGGGGSGAAATAIIGTGVNNVSVTAGGSGYSTAGVTFTGGGGSGASAEATITGGVITAITVVNPGSGYSSAPTVAITGDGTGATATCTVVGGGIIGINITAPGSGYTTAPTLTITGDGSGATAVAVLSPSSLSGVTVVNGGTGYVFAPNITFEGGGGTGATGIVRLTGTSIARVNLVSGGQNYQKVPTVIFTQDSGGTGSGATATAVIAGGAVVAIDLTNGGSGYETNVEVIIQPAGFGTNSQDTGTGAGAVAVFAPTSIGSVQMSDYGLHYTTAPAVIIAPGANNAAYATVTMMPFGVSGSAMETFQSRVWIANPAASPFSNLPTGGNFQVSTASSITDFATSDGGVQFTNTDRFLQVSYIGIRQSNGYLYFYGDSSVSVVSNVLTSGNPATTTFNYQNVDPQKGLMWRDTLADFGRSTIFANPTGVFGLYGGTVSRVSEKLDQLFQTALTSPAAGGVTPSSAVATIFNISHFLMLLTAIDPDTALPRTVMVTWNEREWVISSQTPNLTFIGSQNLEGNTYAAWGTDGSGLFPLFTTPSATLAKRIDTKLYGVKDPFMIKDLNGVYLVAQDQTPALSGVSFNIGLTVSGLTMQKTNDPSVPSQLQTGDAIFFAQPAFQAPKPFWPTFATDGGGLSFTNIGMTLTTTSPDFVLGHMMISYTDSTFIGS